jgi:hypothetical protein
MNLSCDLFFLIDGVIIAVRYHTLQSHCQLFSDLHLGCSSSFIWGFRAVAISLLTKWFGL